MITLPPDVLDLPLQERAEMAMKAAFEKVIIEAAREDRPIHILA